MSRRIRTPAGALVVAAIVAIAVAGGALAFWTGSGSGGSETRVSNPQPLALGVGAPNAQLYPGGTASVAVVATNPNPFSVRIGSLRLDPEAGSGGLEVDDAHRDCDLSSLTFTPQDNDGAGWSLPPRAGDADGALPIDMPRALAMAPDADNTCQGAVFRVHLVAGS